MGKKITEYPNNVSTNPDDLSLMDLSEKTGLSTFESRKWTLTAFKAWVNSWVVAGSVAWNNITGKPNVVDTTGGTNNYVAKFTPDGNTIGNSLIQDDGTNIGIGSAIESNIKIKSSATTPIGFRMIQSSNNLTNISIQGFSNGVTNGSNIGIYGTSNASLGSNVGVYGTSYGASNLNVGIQGSSTGALLNYGMYGSTEGPTGTNIGGFFSANNATSNYCIQLRDSTEAAGKFLKSVTGDGKANWANITVSDVQGSVSSLNGTNNYVAKFTPNGTTIGNSQIQDDGNNIGIFKSPSANVGVYIEGNTSTHTNVIIGNGFKVGAIGVEGASRGAGASENIGVKGIATGSTLRNFGGYMAAGAATVGENIGLYAGATAGSTNYSTQLKDGSETSTGGKFLKDMGDGKANWAYIPKTVQLAVSDETTALTTGTGKITFRMPHAMTLTEVRASLTTAQASGNIFTVDINEGGFSILSTKLTIDNNEKTSVTATTQPVISDTYLTDDTEITVDIDQIGNGTAKGLKITLIGY